MSAGRVESPAMNPDRTFPGGRPVVLAVVLIVALSVLALGLVISGGEAVIAVSRLGDGVRLLPRGLAFSILPLELRVRVPREGDAAVVAVPMTVRLRGGPTVATKIRLLLAGSGGLPLSAGSVRKVGWEKAWSTWLEPRLTVSETEAVEAVRSSARWREVFPGSGAATALDVTSRLAPAFPAGRLVCASVDAEPDSALVRALVGEELRSASPSHGRTVVIGLDALDWGLVDELTRRGVMPNLRALLARGAQLTVRMRPPLLSPLIWTTIATGQPPDVHGVLDFVEPDPGGGPAQPVTSASRKVPALWEMAASAGRTSAVVGWWATYPAASIPGCTIYSDRLSEQLTDAEEERPGLASPPEAALAARQLGARASAATTGLLAPILAVTREELGAVPKGPAGWDDPIGGAARLMAATITVQRLTEHELERGTDVVLSYVEGTDTVGHLFARYRPPPMPGSDPALARRFGPVVDRYHAFIDAWLGRMVGRLGPHDTIVILSDHGFTWDDRPAVSSSAHTPTAVYWHRPDAVLVAAGPLVRPDASRRRIAPLDVLPLLLALAGLPPGADLPGSVPAGLLAGGHPAPVAAVRYAALVPRAAPSSRDVPAADREEAFAKLRALGYIGGTQPGAAPSPAGHGEQATQSPAAAPTANVAHIEARRLHNLAVGLADRGDLPAAEETLRRAIGADASFPPPHLALARVLRLTGRLDEADRELWTAVDLGVGDPPDTLTRVAGEYRLMGRADRAGAVLAEAGRRFPADARIWLDLGTLAGEQGDLALARGCFEKAVSLTPADALAHRNLAMACLGLGDREAARREFGEALRLDPGDAEVRRQLQQLGGSPR